MKTLIVIVLHKCSLKESIAYGSLRQACEKSLFGYEFYVHDNSPVQADDIERTIYYTHHSENPEIGRAHV